MTKITLITGATGGLGIALSESYVNENILLVGRNQKLLDDLKDKLLQINSNRIVEGYAIDLTIPEGYKSLYEYTCSKNYFVNRLINNAGFGDRCDFIDMDAQTQIDMINVNCSSLIYYTRVYLNEMVKNNEGTIINISSIASFYPGPFMCTYHATKALVTNFTLALSYELKHTNIKVKAICPGPFESKFVLRAKNDYTFKLRKPMTAKKVSDIIRKSESTKKVVITIGFKNKLEKFASRFVPNSMLLSMSSKNIKK